MDKRPGAKHSIYVAEIDLDRGELIEEPVKLLTQQGGFESMGIEGTHVVKKEGIYYLFYSGWEGGYAVGYAIAKNVYGPYTRAKNNPLFGAQHDGALVKDEKLFMMLIILTEKSVTIRSSKALMEDIEPSAMPM